MFLLDRDCIFGITFSSALLLTVEIISRQREVHMNTCPYKLCPGYFVLVILSWLFCPGYFVLVISKLCSINNRTEKVHRRFFTENS